MSAFLNWFWHWKTPLILSAAALFFTKRYFNSPFTTLTKKLTGKIIVITGSSNGIGKYAAIELLRQGATVIFATRNEAKTKFIFNKMNSDMKSCASFIRLDLSDFSTIKSFIDGFNAKYDHLDILINNAGILPLSYNQTNDGIEQTLQVNILSPMLLTEGLLEKINRANGRIINVSSLAYEYADIQLLKRNYSEISNCRERYGAFYQYAFSKFGIVAFTVYLNEYLKKRNSQVKVVSLHPGAIPTDLMHSQGWFIYILGLLMTPFAYVFLKTVEGGAQTTLHLCYMDHKDIVSGAYYKDCQMNKLVPVGCTSDNVNKFMMISKKLIEAGGQKLNLVE